MPFGFTGAGDITPRIKWNAQAGRAYRMDRAQNAKAEWETNEVEITNELAFVLDRDSLRQGWINFDTYEQKLFRITDSICQRPPGVKVDKDGSQRPQWSPTLVMRIKLAKSIGGDVREFATSALSVMGVFERLIGEWNAGEHANDDLCPVIKLDGTDTIKQQKTTSFVPRFSTVKWVARPADLTPVTDSTYNTAGNGQADGAASSPAGTGHARAAAEEVDVDIDFPPTGVAERVAAGAAEPVTAAAGGGAELDLDFT